MNPIEAPSLSTVTVASAGADVVVKRGSAASVAAQVASVGMSSSRNGVLTEIVPVTVIGEVSKSPWHSIVTGNAVSLKDPSSTPSIVLVIVRSPVRRSFSNVTLAPAVVISMVMGAVCACHAAGGAVSANVHSVPVATSGRSGVLADALPTASVVSVTDPVTPFAHVIVISNEPVRSTASAESALVRLVTVLAAVAFVIAIDAPPSMIVTVSALYDGVNRSSAASCTVQIAPVGSFGTPMTPPVETLSGPTVWTAGRSSCVQLTVTSKTKSSASRVSGRPVMVFAMDRSAVSRVFSNVTASPGTDEIVRS